MALRIQAKRPVFKPAVYESSRRRNRRLPGWLILLLFGIVVGASGVLFLQASYGPKRLSALESQKLTDELASSSLERQRLQTQLDDTTRSLETERTDNDRITKALTQDVVALKSQVEPLNEQLKLFAQTLPYDSRLGPIAITTASFTQAKAGGKLAYLLLIMQEKADRPELKGLLDLAIEGRHADGRIETITISPIPVSLKHFLHVAGQAELPDGFIARRVTARVLDADGKRPITWRIFTVQPR